MDSNAPYIPAAPGTGEIPGAAPAGILFLRIYCAFQVLFFLLLVGCGVFFIAAPLINPVLFPPAGPGDPPNWIIGGVLTALYLPLLGLYLVGLAAPRRRWLYIYGIAICALSMVCGGCWPLAIPTLIYWLKPELKSWLGA